MKEEDLRPERLDRDSFVPLYFQLQEILKEQIESGHWNPGDMLPSEPDLAKSMGVSRAVVRRALSYLDDDGQIHRVRGRGTFVAEPKAEHLAGGLTRMLTQPGDGAVEVHVLDCAVTSPERSIRDMLGAGGKEKILNVVSKWTAREVPMAICSSFFRRSDIRWLENAAVPGQALEPNSIPELSGVRLANMNASVETSRCAEFEADVFGIPVRAPVFMVLCTEFVRGAKGPRPLEVARVEYRGDRIQFRMDLSNGASGGILEATMDTAPGC